MHSLWPDLMTRILKLMILKLTILMVVPSGYDGWAPGGTEEASQHGIVQQMLLLCKIYTYLILDFTVPIRITILQPQICQETNTIAVSRNYGHDEVEPVDRSNVSWSKPLPQMHLHPAVHHPSLTLYAVFLLRSKQRTGAYCQRSLLMSEASGVGWRRAGKCPGSFTAGPHQHPFCSSQCIQQAHPNSDV